MSPLSHFLVAGIVANLFGVSLVYVLVSTFLDVDVVLQLLVKRKIDLDHHYYFHNLVGVVVYSVLGYLILKKDFGVILLFSLLHLALELFSEAGVPLLYPLSRNRYKIVGLTKIEDFPLSLVSDGNSLLQIILIVLFLTTNLNRI